MAIVANQRKREGEAFSHSSPPLPSPYFSGRSLRFTARTPARLPVPRSAHLLPPLSLSQPQLTALSLSLPSTLFLSLEPPPSLSSRLYGLLVRSSMAGFKESRALDYWPQETPKRRDTASQLPSRHYWLWLAGRGKVVTPCRAPPSSGQLWWPTWVQINSLWPSLRNGTPRS